MVVRLRTAIQLEERSESVSIIHLLVVHRLRALVLGIVITIHLAITSLVQNLIHLDITANSNAHN